MTRSRRRIDEQGRQRDDEGGVVGSPIWCVLIVVVGFTLILVFTDFGCRVADMLTWLKE